MIKKYIDMETNKVEKSEVREIRGTVMRGALIRGPFLIRGSDADLALFFNILLYESAF